MFNNEIVRLIKEIVSCCAPMPLYINEHIQYKKLKLNGQADGNVVSFTGDLKNNALPQTDPNKENYKASL